MYMDEDMTNTLCVSIAVLSNAPKDGTNEEYLAGWTDAWSQALNLVWRLSDCKKEGDPKDGNQ